MTTDSLGIYIHIPFCVRKCRYCDFASFGGLDADTGAAYISRLGEEIRSYSGRSFTPVNSVFFGGGTPSLLRAEELERILNAVHKSFSVSSDCEISLEANPGTTDAQALRAYASLGINRISFGLQSIHENELKMLGRIHSYTDFLSAYEQARSVGISNINLDLMYGIPEQTLDSFSATLDSIISLMPSHISAYGLILEEGTEFWHCRDSLPLPDEDTECRMYRLAADKLSAAGYYHYEISNYAREGMQSRHNLKYWHDEEYVGVGLAAHSYVGKLRYSNTTSLREYLSSDYTKYRTEEGLSPEDEAYEYAMMRLRLAEGFSLAEYKRLFGVDFLIGRENTLRRFSELGLLRISGGRLSFTEEGFYVSNTLLSELL